MPTHAPLTAGLAGKVGTAENDVTTEAVEDDFEPPLAPEQGSSNEAEDPSPEDQEKWLSDRALLPEGKGALTTEAL